MNPGSFPHFLLPSNSLPFYLSPPREETIFCNSEILDLGSLLLQNSIEIGCIGSIGHRIRDLCIKLTEKQNCWGRGVKGSGREFRKFTNNKEARETYEVVDILGY